jgi:hypothetical protein
MKLLLAIVIGGLALAVGLQWRDWPPSSPAPPDVEPAAPPVLSERPAPRLDDARTRDDYLAVIERPLFTPDRRPPPDEAESEPEPVAEVPEEAIAELKGTDVNAILLGKGSAPSVWLRDPRSRDELIRKRIGDDYKGWLVKAIEAERVQFERQGLTETLDLHDFAAAPARPVPGSRNDIRRRLPRRAGTDAPKQP